MRLSKLELVACFPDPLVKVLKTFRMIHLHDLGLHPSLISYERVEVMEE